MTEQETKVVEKMLRFGGSFVKALGECFLRADPINFAKLQNTFPEYWDEYESFGKK